MRYYFLVLVAIAFVGYVSSESCVQCHSRTDPKCATDPNSFLAKQCTNSSSVCYTRVLDGYTIRGCAIDLDNGTLSRCYNEMECLTCTFMEGCNRQVFPLHRKQCLQCQGGSNSTCATNTYLTPTICPIYKIDDQCYIRHHIKENNKAFTRGCLSSAKAQNLCVDEKNCYTCEGAGCNNLLANSTDIPWARDSANVFSYSVSLIFAIAIATRFV